MSLLTDVVGVLMALASSAPFRKYITRTGESVVVKPKSTVVGGGNVLI